MKDIKNLTHKQKLDALDIIEARSRLRKKTRKAYVPHAGQWPAHKSDKFLRYIAAANAYGKSCFAVNEVLARARGFNPWLNKNTPVPARIIVGLDQPMKVETVWLAEMAKWQDMEEVKLEKRGKPYVSAVIFPNGSEVLFTFHDSEPMVWESLEADFLAFDEPMPRNMFIALMRSLRKKQGDPKCLIIGTPISAAWMREELYTPWANGERPDIDFFRGASADNIKNLGDGYIEQFGRFLTDKEKRVRLHGDFFDLDDLALAHLFDRKVHVIESAGHSWPASWPTVVIIDPAMAKPHTALLIGATPDDQIVVLRELRLKGTAPEFSVELKKMMQGFRVTDIVVDSLGSSDLSGGDGVLSFIASLNRHGIRCRATSYNEKSDEAWLSNIREVLMVPLEANNYGLREPRLKILSDCIGLISDIETVSWQRYKNQDDLLKPKLDISKKDSLACLKYGLACQPRFSMGSEKTIRGQNGAGLRQRDTTFRKF